MVRQEKVDISLEERLYTYLGTLKAENADSADRDTAGDLVYALDSLLLKRAVRKRRAIVPGSNEFKRGPQKY